MNLKRNFLVYEPVINVIWELTEEKKLSSFINWMMHRWGEKILQAYSDGPANNWRQSGKLMWRQGISLAADNVEIWEKFARRGDGTISIMINNVLADCHDKIMNKSIYAAMQYLDEKMEEMK